jgi:hypothetical protein
MDAIYVLYIYEDKLQNCIHPSEILSDIYQMYNNHIILSKI